MQTTTEHHAQRLITIVNRNTSVILTPSMVNEWLKLNDYSIDRFMFEYQIPDKDKGTVYRTISLIKRRSTGTQHITRAKNIEGLTEYEKSVYTLIQLGASHDELMITLSYSMYEDFHASIHNKELLSIVKDLRLKN